MPECGAGSPCRMVRRKSAVDRRTGSRVTYARCFLLTLGGLFIASGALGFTAVSKSEEAVSAWLPWLLGGIFVAGLWLLGTGLFGSRKSAEELADKSSEHEAMLIVMILAAPLYYLLKWLGPRK